MQSKNMSQPDEKRSFDKGEVDLVTLGDVTFGRVTLQPGWKWSTCVKPIAKTESCQAPHLQYITSQDASMSSWMTAAKWTLSLATFRCSHQGTMHGL